MKKFLSLALIGSIMVTSSNLLAAHGGHEHGSSSHSVWDHTSLPWYAKAILATGTGIVISALSHALSHHIANTYFKSHDHSEKGKKAQNHFCSAELAAEKDWDASIKNNAYQIELLGRKCKLGDKESCAERDALEKLNLGLIRQARVARSKALEKAEQYAAAEAAPAA